MYVCVCFAVTEDEVHEAIEEGASSREEVTRACRAGGDCGSCHAMLDELIEARSTSGDEAIPCERLVRRRGHAA